MIAQIYTMQSVDEALEVIERGVDQVGITPSNIGLPGEVSLDTAASIVNAVRGKAISVALSVDSDLDNIASMVRKVKPDILHLCGLENTLSPKVVQKLRDKFPGQKIMQAISIAGKDAIEMAQSYEQVSDYLILDTQDPDIAGIGASGETHDWSISQAIVNEVKIPVILAGGLSPENVAEAIEMVQPWGVDSLTHTNRPLENGGFEKDLDRVESFVKAAKDQSA